MYETGYNTYSLMLHTKTRRAIINVVETPVLNRSKEWDEMLNANARCDMRKTLTESQVSAFIVTKSLVVSSEQLLSYLAR